MGMWRKDTAATPERGSRDKRSITLMVVTDFSPLRKGEPVSSRQYECRYMIKCINEGESGTDRTASVLSVLLGQPCVLGRGCPCSGEYTVGGSVGKGSSLCKVLSSGSGNIYVEGESMMKQMGQNPRIW